MSGICGIINIDGAPVHPAQLRSMAEAAAHRAPDGIGYWIDNHVGLAYLATHIAPEDPLVAQPVCSATTNNTVAAHARVDNRDDIIHLLNQVGLLSTERPSDAELILAGYIHWGTKLFDSLIADFVFAIWDSARNTLFAARDLLGTRPFYYQVDQSRFLFASEVGQILAVSSGPIELNEEKLGRWLANTEGGIEDSFYRGIHHLPPAHALLCRPDGIRIWRYGDFSVDRSVRYRAESDYVEHFREIFLKAVSSRLRSIKPVGISLSGGVDSSSVAAASGWLVRNGLQEAPPEVRTYSYAFQSLTEADERHISTPLARHFGLPVVEIAAEENWPLKDYPIHGPDRDDPNLGPYQVLKHAALLQARSDGVGAMMTGYWGDHSVNDAWPYVDQFLAGRWTQLWSDMQAHAERWGWREIDVLRAYLLSPLPTYLWPAERHPAVRAFAGKLLRKSGLTGNLYSASQSVPAWMREDFAARVGLLKPEVVPERRLSEVGYAANVRYQNMTTAYQIESSLWQERTHANFGLELTHVWNDRRIIEYMLSIPPRVLSRRGEYKPFAHALLAHFVPEDMLYSFRKIYPSPLFWAAMKGPARDQLRMIEHDSSLARLGIAYADKLSKLVEATLAGEDERAGFWAPLTAEMWLRAFWS